MNAVRRIVGTAIAWGIALSATATTLFVGIRRAGLLEAEYVGTSELVALALRTMVVGTLAGGAFGAFLANTERARSLAGVSTRRVALWSFGIGACVPALAVGAAGVAGLIPLSVLLAASAVAGGAGSLACTSSVITARRAMVELGDGPTPPLLPRE